MYICHNTLGYIDIPWVVVNHIKMIFKGVFPESNNSTTVQHTYNSVLLNVQQCFTQKSKLFYSSQNLVKLSISAWESPKDVLEF